MRVVRFVYDKKRDEHYLVFINLAAPVYGGDKYNVPHFHVPGL